MNDEPWRARSYRCGGAADEGVLLREDEQGRAGVGKI